MIYVIEKSFNIKLNNIMKVHHLKHGVGSVNGMFNGSVRTKSITIIAELCFADWFHDLLDTLLYQPIPYAWDSQRTCFSVWFRDIFPSYRLWSVAVFASRNNKSHSFYHIIRSSTPNICDVLFICSCRVAAFVRLMFRYASKMLSLLTIKSIRFSNTSPF